MGREKVSKPRKSGTGHGGIKPDALTALEEFPMDLNKVTEDPTRTAMVMLRTGTDPAVRALRRVLETAGRLAYFEAAFDKGLTVEQAERLEGLLIFLKELGRRAGPQEEGEKTDD
jgi:hypothetical protein